MPCFHHRLDEVQQLAVGPVFDAAGSVVFEGHAPVGDRCMELAVGVAVEVGQDDAIGLYSLACEQVDDLVSARADLGMDQDGRAGLAAADGGCHQPTFLEHADALIGSARLDHARARRIWRRRAEPVVGVHPTL